MERSRRVGQETVDTGWRITRRRFFALVAGGLAWSLTGPPTLGGTSHRVGVGRTADPYEATRRAIEASQGWPAGKIAGRKVVIKPNLVRDMTAETGVVTEPQVVRAVVDLALESGAAEVLIVESGPFEAYFSACGYDFFSRYDPQGRVALVDLKDVPARFYRVLGGLAYWWISMPTLVMEEDVVFISVAKMKTHLETFVSLSMKNLFGLPPLALYRDSWRRARIAMHERGVHQTVVDLNLIRPIDFAVVDGIWAMEGDGPWDGTPVRMDLVVAGQNALAVDRVCLAAMGFPQDGVRHLVYASAKELGPDMGEIEVHGDPLPRFAFAWPDVPPGVDIPTCTPRTFSPRAGQSTSIVYRVDRPCRTRVEIVRLWEIRPWVWPVRTLHDWTDRPAGLERLVWDGRDESGDVVPPGRYAVRVRADAGQKARDAYATGWVWVV